MDTTQPSEEKSPLLLYIDNNEELVVNNKRKFNKYRVHGITSGATAVITEFPSYINTCWLTSLISCLLLFMAMLLLISSVTSNNHHRIPRCPTKENFILDNKTIHLVHSPLEWTSGELEALENILQTYPAYKTHLIVIHNYFKKQIISESTTQHLINKNNTIVKEHTTNISTSTHEIPANPFLRKFKFIERRSKRKIEDNKMGLNMGIRNLLDILLHSKANALAPENKTGVLYISKFEEPVSTTEKPKTINEIIRTYPQIILENTTYSESFSDSPLRRAWKYMDEDLRIFALRVLQLWHYGGVSFSLNGKSSNSSFSLAEKENRDKNKLQNFIKMEKLNIEYFPFGIVLSDEEGYRIISKTPCHAFFAEVLNNLRTPGLYTNVKQVIQASVVTFCKYGAVEKKYCDEVLKSQRQ